MTRAAYQSGSSRATPGRASKAVLCGTGRSTTTVRALVGGFHSGGSGRRRAGRQAAEGAVEQAGEIGLVDVAHRRDDQAVADQAGPRRAA